MLVLDAGAFVAVERGDRDVAPLVKAERQAGRAPGHTRWGRRAGVAWRARATGPARSPAGGVEVQPLDDGLGRRAGVLLGRAGTSDVVDAAVVLLAGDGDLILSSDPGDLVGLAAAADLHVDVTPV